MMRIKLVNLRSFVCRLLRRKHSVGMQIIWRDCGPCQRPFMLIAPVSADEDAAFGSFVRISATHHKDSHRQFAVDSVIRSLEPAIEPAQLKLIEINGSVGAKLGFTGVAASAPTVRPRAHDQALQALLVL